MSLIKQIAQDKGKTFILSSHNPNHALYLDSNVCVLKNGLIADAGRAKDVITVENLAKVYGNNICYSDELPYREISCKDVMQ